MFSNLYVRIAGHVVFGLALVAAFAALFGWVVMLAWNAVVPGVTGLPALDYLQAVAGLVLVRVLAGRIIHPHGGPRHWRRWRGGHRHGFGRGRMRFAARCRPESDHLYAAWWEHEGEQAFRAFAARHLGESAQPDVHGR